MGIFKCNEHGLTGFRLVCKHISKLDKTLVNKIEELTVSDGLENFSYFVCDQCKSKIGKNKLSFKEFTIETTPACFECFNELKENITRKRS